ncbi:MAG: response regulator [Actinomycetota bacterium]|nr:response regulator [Actinomycetota bacterium]
MKILIVDDSKAMRMIVTRTLRQAGYGDHTFLEAGDGSEGLALVASEKPDLVLSDWNMPEVTGIEFLRALRERGDDVRFGFVTSESTEAMRETAREAGALFLIAKPFTADTFTAALNGVLVG